MVFNWLSPPEYFPRVTTNMAGDEDMDVDVSEASTSHTKKSNYELPW